MARGGLITSTMSLTTKASAKAEYQARELKRAMVKEELVVLTGSAIDAIILNYFLYCQSRSRTVEKYLAEERQRMTDAGIAMNVAETNGWFYKKAGEVSEETMVGLSDSNVRRRIARMVEKGWLTERSNPYHKWDKTLQYRAELAFIENQLQALGYHLDGWMIERVRPDDEGGETTIAVPSSKTDVRDSKTKARSSKTENGASNSQLRDSQNETAYQEYPYKNIHTRDTNNNIQQPSAEMSVADENFSNSDLAPLAPTPEIETASQSVREKLLDFIGVRNIEANSNEIDALLQKWPAAKLEDGELVSALMGDYEIYNLDKPADENIARAAVKADAQRLRWFMCVWPGFEEAGDAYHDRTNHRWTKAQCFWKRWKTAQPPATWLEDELGQLRGAAAREASVERDREAKAFWASLSPEKQRKFDNETLEVLNERGGGQHFAKSSDEFASKRRELLLDPNARDWILGVPMTATPSSEQDSASPPESASGAAQVAAPVQMNLEVYIGPILADITEGLLALEDIEECRIKILEDDEWESVKTAVMERLAA